jgi:hypothetical protein
LDERSGFGQLKQELYGGLTEYLKTYWYRNKRVHEVDRRLTQTPFLSLSRLFARRLNLNSLANALPRSDPEPPEVNNLTDLRLDPSKEQFPLSDLFPLSPFLTRSQSPTLPNFVLPSEPTAFS